MTAEVTPFEPLFGPSDAPDRHRVKGKKKGDPAQVVKGRRKTPIVLAQSLRGQVAEWRSGGYAGASDTSRELLNHWFNREHEVITAAGEVSSFAYYFCQREAMETLIYLYEVRRLRALSALIGEFGGAKSDTAALGVSPEEDRWARYAFKVATGAGKTKIMSLAIVWSYFHSIFEPDSRMARDFLIIAPGVTVFERLKEDFKPADGGPSVFDTDPLVPLAWKSDWNVSVVLQDEPSAAALGGTIYLTNIHRLYKKRRRSKVDAEEYEWMGPNVQKSSALDPSEELRKRIVSHKRLLVMNDEAHHVWDPGSAWNEALGYLDAETRAKGGSLVAQLDFSATPRDNKGQVFAHVVVDTPLGEAVDGGIVKTPIIGTGDGLAERAHDDAARRYESHLLLGYKRWEESWKEWEKSGKKPLIFVMTEDTQSADEIAQRLNTDPTFKLLNGKTINLHTNLKGKLKKQGKGANERFVFVEDEKEITDDDLRELRKLSRELDDNSSPYRCIVSVLMLREGWDVRNVTTIVPLRPLTAKSKILPEQTLGRGLRRMTPPSGPDSVAEAVSVVEHESFVSLYQDELADEGLPIEEVEADDIPRMTVTIFPDEKNKDLEGLDLRLPVLSQGFRIDSDLSGINFEEIRAEYSGYSPLPLGEKAGDEIKYEGYQLITDELVEQMEFKLPLLSDPVGAISFFREEIEKAVRVRNTHEQLAPLIQRFIEELLFEEQVELYDARVISRLADSDARVHIRAAFIPLLRKKVTTTQQRLPEKEPMSVIAWKAYQATSSATHPTLPANSTPFNLVPCNRQLEAGMTHFLDKATDVVAFAKNQGPQSLRIDCLLSDAQRTLYCPDFIIRLDSGKYVLAETKGRQDSDVAAKARGAVDWCKAASAGEGPDWSYLFVPQKIFEEFSGDSISQLLRTCQPALKGLLEEAEAPQLSLSLSATDESSSRLLHDFISQEDLDRLPASARREVESAVMVFAFMADKPSMGFSPAFQPLLGSLDKAAERLMVEVLSTELPEGEEELEAFFSPNLDSSKDKTKKKFLLARVAQLKKLLVYASPVTPMGLLEFCLQYASKAAPAPPGILAATRESFYSIAQTKAPDSLKSVYEFRNKYVAHVKDELLDRQAAEEALHEWIELLLLLRQSLASVEAA